MNKFLSITEYHENSRSIVILCISTSEYFYFYCVFNEKNFNKIESERGIQGKILYLP